MEITGIHIANLIIETLGVTVSGFALFFLVYTPQFGKRSRVYFFAGFTSLLLFNAANLLLELLDSCTHRIHFFGIVLFGFISLITAIVTAFIVTSYLISVLIKNKETKRRITIFVTVCLSVAIFMCFFAQFTGRLVFVNEAGHYAEGDWAILGHICVAFYMMIDLLMLLNHKNTLASRHRRAYAIYLWLPLIAIFVRYWTPGLYLVELSSTIAMALSLILIMRERSDQYTLQEKNNEQMKVDLMLSQIQPHFLFNALYVIQEICHTDPELAAAEIGNFSRYLRHNMNSIAINSPIPFTEELQHTKRYVQLQQLRFGNTLDVLFDIQCKDFMMPTLTLQPIVENAIRYGVRQNEDGKGTVSVSTAERDDWYEITVKDNGPGFIPDQAVNDNMSHVGLDNVRKRLKRISDGRLVINSVIGEGTTVKIVIPKEK